MFLILWQCRRKIQNDTKIVGECSNITAILPQHLLATWVAVRGKLLLVAIAVNGELLLVEIIVRRDDCSWGLLLVEIPGNKLVQNKEQINVKRGLNSTANLWPQFNYSITFEINCKIIDINIH